LLSAPTARWFNGNFRTEFRRVTGTYALLIAANALAWAWAICQFSGRPTLLGIALLAYVFGLRHAVDADHIAAIDNVVRKLLQEGKRPHLAGLYFSLGHSTVVVLATLAVAVGATTLQGDFDWLRDTGGMFGTGISALFLLVIAFANLAILKSVWLSFQQVQRGGRLDAGQLDLILSGQGLLTRLLRPLLRMIAKSWQMYPLGFLFGLGFDTATEIGLLGISASQATQHMAPLTILIFPALFTAGMMLVDTTDGLLMVGAYGWAFVNPVRKLWYNLTITTASVLVAMLIGGIEALGVLADKFNLAGSFWILVDGLNHDLESFGLLIIGSFVACWFVSALIYRWKRYEQCAPESVN